MSDEFFDDNNPEAYIESFKKTLLAVKCVIQQLDYTAFPTPQKSYDEFKKDNEEVHPHWLHVVKQMHNIAQKVFGKLEDALQNQGRENSNYDLNDLMHHDPMTDVSNAVGGKKENTAVASSTSVASDNHSSSTKEDCITPPHKTVRDHIESCDLVGKSLGGNFKVLFEKVIMYHKKYSTLLQSWKQLNGKVNKCRKLITETNCSSSEKIQELVNSLSNISKENKKLHLKIVGKMNQTDMLREKITALHAKKANNFKHLQEKDNFLEELENETAKLSQCLRSFCELKQILQQHLHKKRSDFEKNSEQMQLNIAQKEEEVENLESMYRGHKNTIIPPIKSELQSWKNSLIDANKQVEKFTKYLYALRKKKESVHHEHALIERSIDELRSHILMQQESFRSKEKKCKQSKLELENKYRELRNQLQKITNATLLDDMCYANLKISENADAYKQELSTLITHQNESRANKKQINEQIHDLNESTNTQSLQLAQAIETSHQCRQQVISEFFVSKGQLLLQSHGVTFLREQQDKLKEQVIYLHQQLEAIRKSEDTAAQTSLIFLNHVKNMNSKLRFLKDDRENQMRVLGFRCPMVMQCMEECKSEARNRSGFEGERSERIIYETYENKNPEYESSFSNMWEYINEISYSASKFESIHDVHYFPVQEVKYKTAAQFSFNFESTKFKYHHLNGIYCEDVYVW